MKLFANENRHDTIYRSKAVGEPPLLLAFSVFLCLARCGGLAGPSGRGALCVPWPPPKHCSTPSKPYASHDADSAASARPPLAGPIAPGLVVEVTQTCGSTPREAGARMLVSADDVVGTIGGGHLEWQAASLARHALTECRQHERPPAWWSHDLALGPCSANAVAAHCG